LAKNFVISSDTDDSTSQGSKDKSKTTKSLDSYGPGWIHGVGKAITPNEAQEYLKARKEK